MPAKKRNPRLDARAVELRAAGWTYEQIARELGVSIETARQATKAPMPAATGAVAPIESPSAPETPWPTSSPPPPPAPPGDAPPADALGTLQMMATSLREALRGQLDTNTQLSITRLLKDVALAIAKLTPPPPPRHELAPDMIAARDAVRERIKIAMDREARRREDAPKCAGCGAPQLPRGEESPVQELIRWVFDAS